MAFTIYGCLVCFLRVLNDADCALPVAIPAAPFHSDAMRTPSGRGRGIRTRLGVLMSNLPGQTWWQKKKKRGQEKRKKKRKEKTTSLTHPALSWVRQSSATLKFSEPATIRPLPLMIQSWERQANNCNHRASCESCESLTLAQKSEVHHFRGPAPLASTIIQ